MSLNKTKLGRLAPWYNAGHVVAYGYLNGSKSPIRTDWIVKIDREKGLLYVKNGCYEIAEEIWDDTKAKRLFGHLHMNKKTSQSISDAIGRIAAAREKTRHLK